MPMWLYAAACVAVPAVWGLVMFVAFDFVDRRRAPRRKNAPPPIDYSI